MKKIIQINSVCNGSTGKIMGEIQKEAIKNGFEAFSFYGRRKPFFNKTLKCEKICNYFSVILHGCLTLLFNHQGYYSYFTTKKLIKKIKKIQPDIIQLHNIHGYYLNYNILFNYLKNEYKGKIFWTFHDCWPFTGHCAHFTYANCKQWQLKCKKCPQIKKYPYSLFFDSSQSEYENKKNKFSNIKNLTIITPSDWLNQMVKESFFENNKVITINNGIDLTIFKKYENDNYIYSKYNIPENKKIILGVTNIWNNMKGLDDFFKLSTDISKDIIIVLVGLNKKQINLLPKNIIGICRTNNQIELAKIYSLADIFVNFTKEDNYPTVNLEAIACGTPVITYDIGGCREQIFNRTGFVCKNYQNAYNKITKCLEIDYKNVFFNNSDSLDSLDSKNKYKEYLKLYEE